MVDKGNISRYVSTAARKTLHDHHRAVVYPLRHQGVPTQTMLSVGREKWGMMKKVRETLDYNMGVQELGHMVQDQTQKSY